jgi:outer membrane protein assembly factor BamB
MPRRRTVLGAIALICSLLAAVLVLHLYGIRIDWNGNMSHVTIRNLASDNAAVEQSRAAQKAEPVPTPPPAEVAEPAAAAPVKLVKAAYWTDFRGPNRAGEYTESPINTEWPSAGLPRLWKQPIGGGYASFTVGEGRAYTIEQRRDKEAVTAYNIETGRELWAFSYPASFDEVLGGPGPRATPVYHDGLVYSLGALGDLYCLTAATGKPKWSKNILADNDAKDIHWAMSGSPLIVGDMVIVTPGGPNGKSIVAYNRITGASLWKSLNDRAAYTSPILATLAGQRQIVWISGERAVGIGVEDGKLLWEYPWPAQMDMNCSQPVIIDGDDVLLSSAQGPGAALLRIAQDAGAFTATPVWKNNRLKNKFNSSVLYQGYIYGFDEAILECFDPKTGDVKWKGGRYGYGQLLLAGGFLVVTTEQGELVLVRATPESHQEMARFQAIEGKTWNIPAIDNGLLLVRNTREMACFRLGR